MFKEVYKSFLKIGFVSYLLFMAFIAVNYLRFPFYLYQTDLMNFLTGARIIKEGAAPRLYEANFQLEIQNKINYPLFKETLLPFRNIPMVAVFFIPLTLLDLRSATFAMFLINVALFLIFHKLFILKIPKLSKVGYLWMAIFIFWPVVSTLLLGQNVGVPLIVTSLMYFSLIDKRYFLTGVTSSLLIIRPHNMLILPFVFFMVQSKYKFIIGLLISLAALFLINVAITDVSVLMHYPEFALSIENTFFEGKTPHISSIYFALKEMLPAASGASLLTINIFLYSLFLGIFALKVRHFSEIQAFTISILASTLFAIHVLSHDLILLLPPIYLLTADALSKGRDILKEKLIIVLFFVPVLNIIGIPILTTAILTAVMVYLLFYKVDREANKINSKTTI